MDSMAAEVEEDRIKTRKIFNQSLKIFLGEGSEDQAGKGVIEITATRTSTLKISP
jgi:hypothetical protein